MTEFWAVVGLACLDKVFLGELTKHRANPGPTIKEYGFRLSRWEMGELQRILSIEEVRHHMHMICEVAWENAFLPADRAPCWWSSSLSKVHDDPNKPPYRHPLNNGRPVPGGGDDGGNDSPHR